MPEDGERLWWAPDVVVVRRRPPPDLPSIPSPALESWPPSLPVHRPRRWLLVVGLALVLAAVGLGIGLALSGGGGGSSGPSGSSPAAPAARAAAAVNVKLSDLPAGWSVDRSGSAPLSGFLAIAPGGGSASADPGAPGAGPSSFVARQYESCLGIDAGGDALFGVSNPRPLVEVSSPAFRAPVAGSGVEAGSETAIYRSASPVRRATAQMGDPRFGPCFSAALTQELMAGAAEAARGAAQPAGAGPTGTAPAVTFGSPTSTVLTLPPVLGTVAAGVEVTVPFVVSGVDHKVGIGMVVVGGGRMETTIVTASGPDGFPPPLLETLAGNVQHRLAALTQGLPVLSATVRG